MRPNLRDLFRRLFQPSPPHEPGPDAPPAPARAPGRLRTLVAKYGPWLVAVGASIIATWLGLQPAPHIPPLPKDDLDFVRPPDGWIDDPAAVQLALAEIEKEQGFAPYFETAAPNLVAGATDDPVFFWQAEEKVLGKVLDSWNQGNIGSCVSHGWGRGVQDLILIQIAAGKNEEWPGAEVNREAIYGGMRVQVGGGKIRGDGGVGAWAAKWVQEQYGGTIFNQQYPSQDLSGGYSVQRCREWGQKGCPKELVPEAKKHPVGGVALVRTAEEVWAAVGNGYPVPICSGVGFQSPLRDGFCQQRGSWAHCMEVRGRFKHPSKGKCFVIQNSWGDYLKSDGTNNQVDVEGRGKVALPKGCFAVTAADLGRIVREGESYAVSAFKGFPRQKIDWFAARPAGERRHLDTQALFALAP